MTAEKNRQSLLFYRVANDSVSAQTHGVSAMYLKTALAVKHMALLKCIHICT